MHITNGELTIVFPPEPPTITLVPWKAPPAAIVIKNASEQKSPKYTYVEMWLSRFRISNQAMVLIMPTPCLRPQWTRRDA